MSDVDGQRVGGQRDEQSLVTAVREHYARIATKGSSCCGPSSCGCSTAETSTVTLDVGARGAAPAGADLGLSCGIPLAHLNLQPGERLLDLGSGSGIDVFVAARALGPQGRAIGVDMTPEMVERARAIAEREGFTNVEFLLGRLEAVPLPDASIDAVTSNCVLNLVPDKTRVYHEVARVLKPGGRLVISDILLSAPLPPAIASDVLAYAGCISGAALREDCFAGLRAAGLTEIEVLSDVDALGMLDPGGHQDAESVVTRAGASFSDVDGLVRSVTYRARKPR